MDVKVVNGIMTITVPLNATPTPSASGKSLVLFSTQGNVKTPVEVQGKPVTIGLNVYIKK